MNGYEEPRPPRFQKELVPGGYEFVIPARRNWFVLIFLIVWLTGWTFGGVMAMVSLITEREPFLAVWLIFWAVGWFFAAMQILFMLTGAEYIRCVGGDLELGYKGFVLPRRRRFRGTEIRRLGASDLPAAPAFGGFKGWGYLVPGASQPGPLSFDHGARTIYAGFGLDRAEAELIVADLLRSLPAAR